MGEPAMWAESQKAERGANDVPALKALQERFVQRYFPGYGEYIGKVRQVDETRFVADVQYEDGDSEELYLDQLQEALLPDGYIPEMLKANDFQGVSKYGFTWPPPSVSQKLMVHTPRNRKPSAAATQRMLMQQALQFEKEHVKKLKEEKRQAKLAAKEKKEEAKLRKKKADAEKKKVEQQRNSEKIQRNSKKSTHPTIANNKIPNTENGKAVAIDRNLNSKHKESLNEEREMHVLKKAKLSKPQFVPPKDPIKFGRKRRLLKDGQTVLLEVDGVPSQVKLLDIGLRSNRDVEVANMRIMEAMAVVDSLRSSGEVYQGIIDVSQPVPLPPPTHSSNKTSSSENKIKRNSDSRSDSNSSNSSSRNGTSNNTKGKKSTSVPKKTASQGKASSSLSSSSSSSKSTSSSASLESSSSNSKQNRYNAEKLQAVKVKGMKAYYIDSSSPKKTKKKSAQKSSSTKAKLDTALKERAWTMCDDCNRKHWNDEKCRQVENMNKAGEKIATMRKKWTCDTTASLFESLSAYAKLRKKGGISVASHPVPNTSTSDETNEEQQERLITESYKIVNSKHEITCGADGRYGITGNVRRGSMTKMLDYLRTECELDESASIIDLGHGMGRPNFHIASLVPFVKASVGTEFNPGLYKLSMLALRDLARLDSSFYEHPRVFFMDMNIRDMVSLEPFSHIYVFNIGMPDDLILHIFRLILTCKTAKYAVIYPHRLASVKRIAAIGKVVHTISMSMPGGCSYEGMIVKLHPYDERLGAIKEEENDDVEKERKEGVSSLEQKDDSEEAKEDDRSLVHVADSLIKSIKSSTIIGDTNYETPTMVDEKIDPCIEAVFKILDDKEIYRLYVEQLGIAGALDREQDKMRNSRSSRRNASNTEFFRMSPCFPDIPIGLLRRVCVGLGISTVGDKVALLSTIQHYVPLTFRLSLFATGHNYTVDDVNSIISKLLIQEPSRRQPELT